MNKKDLYSKLIKPVRDNFIKSIISEINQEIFSPYDKEFTWQERIEPIEQLKESFLRWISGTILGIDKFPYVYVTNGNTDSLNNIFSNYKEPWSWKKNDYIYYEYWHTLNNRQHTKLDAPFSTDNHVFTWPGYRYGNRDELNFALKSNSKNLHLDCAYLGLCRPDILDISNFSTASFSFSKCLSIPYNRIGLLYSKTEIPTLAIMNNLGYVNLSGVKIAQLMLDKIPYGYFYQTYNDKISQICDKNKLSKTDCILFAYKNDTRISLAEYWTQDALLL